MKASDSVTVASWPHLADLVGGSWAWGRVNGLVLREGSAVCDPLAWVLARGHFPAFLHFFRYLFIFLADDHSSDHLDNNNDLKILFYEVN